MDQNHLILLCLSFLILIATDEAVRTPAEPPNRGRRPIVPSTPGYNIPTTPGYDTGRNPPMQNLGASQGSYPPPNPFLTSDWDTMPNMSMAPGPLQQQQNWDRQQQSVLQQYPASSSTEYLGSPSFNQPRKQTVSNSGRHNSAANASLGQWSNPSTYEAIVKQQKADGYNYGDYDGELILDFEFARPADDTENEDEPEKEDNTTGSDTKPGGERVEKSERPKKKAEKKVEDSSSEVKKTKTAKKKVDESTRTDKKKVDESTRLADKKKAQKDNVEAIQLEEKYEKKLEKSVEQLRLSLNEQKMCSLQNSKDCWMRLFDALAELDDELRYSNMIQYCSENKQQIRYCGGSNCPDIENVIVFKKTEEDEVVIEEEENDEKEEKEQKSEEQNVTKTDHAAGDHSADQQSLYDADHYSQSFNTPEPLFDGIASYLKHSRSQIAPTGQYGQMGTPPSALQPATAPQYHFPSDGHSMAQLPYPYDHRVLQQPNPPNIYSMLNPMHAQAEQAFYQPEHQQLDHHQPPLPPIVNNASPKKRRNKPLNQQTPAQSQPFHMPETRADGTAAFLHHSTSRIESTGQYGSRMGTVPIGQPVAEPEYQYSPAFYQHGHQQHDHHQHPFSAMAHQSSYGATGYQSSDGVSPNRPAYGQPQSDHSSDPNIYYPYSQPKNQQKRGGGKDRQGYAQNSQSGTFIPQDNLQNSAAYSPQRQPSQYGMPGYSQSPNYPMQHQQQPGAGTAQYAQQGNQNAGTGGYHDHGPAMPRPVHTVPSGGGRQPISMKPNAAAVPANPRRPKGTTRQQQQQQPPPPARRGSVSGPNTVDEYDFTVFNVNENRKQSSTTSKASSSSSSAKLEQRKPETAEEKKEHIGKHLSMYMRCVNKLLTERAPIGLIHAGDSTNFLQLLYGLLLPKPLFLAQQLNMALNGVPKDQIDNPLLMAPKIAPSAADTLPVETSMSKNVLNKLSKSNKQASNVKHDVRAVLEIASTQSREQLKQIRKISEALGYPNFADAGKIFIKHQSATFEAKESIVKFLDWRLMGRAVAPIKEDYSKKHPEIRSAKADAKTLYIAMKVKV